MEFRPAATVDEALGALRELGDEARVLAGGTDVMIQKLRGEIPEPVLLHIERIDEMREVAIDGVTTLGALVTHRTLATDQRLVKRHPALAEGAATVGGWQTQAVGTVGGNICNASPAADTAPPLLVADARVTLSSTDGERAVPLSDFFQGRRATARRPHELVTAITLEPVPDDGSEVYLKVGRRGAMEVAVVGLALRVRFADSGVITDARVATCSVAPTPRRVPEAEAALVQSGGEALEDAAEAIAAAANPIDDPRASAAYRSAVLRSILPRAVAMCRERAGQ